MDARVADQIVRQHFTAHWDEIMHDQGTGQALRQAYASGQIRTVAEAVDKMMRFAHDQA